MTKLMSPANLMDELDDDSSHVYVRRVVARILGHAGLALFEAKDIWITTARERGDEQAPAQWEDRYIPMVQAT